MVQSHPRQLFKAAASFVHFIKNYEKSEAAEAARIKVYPWSKNILAVLTVLDFLLERGVTR